MRKFLLQATQVRALALYEFEIPRVTNISNTFFEWMAGMPKLYDFKSWQNDGPLIPEPPIEPRLANLECLSLWNCEIGAYEFICIIGKRWGTMRKLVLRTVLIVMPLHQKQSQVLDAMTRVCLRLKEVTLDSISVLLKPERDGGRHRRLLMFKQRGDRSSSFSYSGDEMECKLDKLRRRTKFSPCKECMGVQRRNH
ncbi:hypothetical protein GGR52DRAFT_318940 [Hypoxylon sp. FL1284]|nr:hypothetical protein GGR52DRAFT_318940 [Hypoxylon sp. FL1284]